MTVTMKFLRPQDRANYFALLAALALAATSCQAAPPKETAAPAKAATQPDPAPQPAKAATPQAPLDFEKSGQTWAFLGDSITHGGSYHEYVQLFLSTRYPGRDFWTLNAGRSGDTAIGTVGDKRAAFDLKAAAPSVVFLHFGMNDVGWTGYKGKVYADAQSKRMATYTQNMEKLVGQVRDMGAKVAIISPTAYDDTSASQKFNHNLRTGLNDELGKYGEFGQQLAQQNGFPFVDVHTLMTQLNVEKQKQDEKFTLTRDRVHPNDNGNEVFAYQLLKQIGVQPLVYRVEIDAATNKAQAQNATVVQHTATPRKVTFELNETALPFPIVKENWGFKGLVPFEKDLNQQTLRVSGLNEGKYQLSIDGQPVAQTDSKELAQGLNLSDNEKTPQYQVALAIRELIFPEKMELEREVRDLSVMMIGLDGYDWETDDETALKLVAAWYESKPNKGGWHAYLNNANKTGIPRRKEIRAKLADIRRQLAAVPREMKHSYEITPLAP